MSVSIEKPTIAKFDGKCGACGLPIFAGTEIEPHDVDEIRVVQSDAVIRRVVVSWAHVTCPEIRELGEVCTTCFLEKPCPCEDDQ